ncbi:hypothetical protein I6A60_18960 [Frankia sp. AgB1.9]|uniref:hypothetical protein n=1 Tax=unclassified Frankia TaxID=2632575 RepID=UPI00193162C8|nr:MULTISPECIES: hypothetical protein [unclassified Frankia]MBL7487878.1 hypothetical protein [Frankia sp. AgW1.1]MBL7549942.1 hypothetical protein [Frankia sp. AgB1.9]MBL7621479.1 hypothetical protein [Frankia sp. AgB1.8]
MTYLLVKYLGGGGSGEVWLAANSRQERWAIKLFKAKPNKRSVLYQRFVNEVERVRDLTGVKGIVPVVDAYLPDDPNGGTAYLVMPQCSVLPPYQKPVKVVRIRQPRN